MRLTTPVQISSSIEPIDLGSSVLCLGSCFAERIGQKLDDALFPVVLNPTGIHYNPVSLSRDLKPHVTKPRLFLHDGRWRSLEHHSRLAWATPERTSASIEEAETVRQGALHRAQVLILTLGTAQVFETVNGLQVVSNCHRLPQSLFNRRRLSVCETVAAVLPLLARWLAEAPERRVLLTVSPIRHLRGGLIENSRAKAVLLLACDQLRQELPRTEYFPAYEILCDELRDYRFYRDDFIQPNDLAVGVIWEKFCQTYFTSSTRDTLTLIQKASLLTKHQLTPHSKPRTLAKKGLGMLAEIELKQPGLDTSRLSEVFNDWNMR